jgi:hypothetical protein
MPVNALVLLSKLPSSKAPVSRLWPHLPSSSTPMPRSWLHLRLYPHLAYYRSTQTYHRNPRRIGGKSNGKQRLLRAQPQTTVNEYPTPSMTYHQPIFWPVRPRRRHRGMVMAPGPSLYPRKQMGRSSSFHLLQETRALPEFPNATRL